MSRSKTRIRDRISTEFSEFMLAGELALLAATAGLFPNHVLAEPVKTDQVKTGQENTSDRTPAASDSAGAAEAGDNGMTDETSRFLKEAGLQVEKNFKYTSE